MLGFPVITPGLSFLPRTCSAVCVESSPLTVRYCLVLSVCDDGGTLETTSAELSSLVEDWDVQLLFPVVQKDLVSQASRRLQSLDMQVASHPLAAVCQPLLVVWSGH